MMTLIENPLLQTRLPIQLDQESELVAQFTEATSEVGIYSDRTAVVNFYVALKSRPLMILTGPEKSGKIALVRCLARSLMGGDCPQYQMLVGHPWSSEKSDNIALFTQAQTSLTSEKLLSLIEEAWHPENTHRLYIACITRLSPAELLSFFTEVSYQLRNGELMQFGDVHFSEPLPFPPNLFLIGTMDTPHFDLWNKDLLSNATVVHWPKAGLLTRTYLKRDFSSQESEFLRSCTRNRQAVYHKIHAILGWQRQPLRPLVEIEAVLQDHNIQFSDSLIDEAMVYLANSWSSQGNGLFDPSTSRNLEIALDLAIAQTILPHTADAMQRNPVLREELLAVLSGQFPRSAAFISALANRYQDGLIGETIEYDSSTYLRKEVRFMVKDLVCGMEIDPKTAAGQSDYMGQTYYFCSLGCKKAFDKEPEKYVKVQGHASEHGHHH